MKVEINYLRWLKEELDKIERVPFDEIVWLEAGVEVDTNPEIKEEFQFMGLCNRDFILAGIYKE